MNIKLDPMKRRVSDSTKDKIDETMANVNVHVKDHEDEIFLIDIHVSSNDRTTTKYVNVKDKNQ